MTGDRCLLSYAGIDGWRTLMLSKLYLLYLSQCISCGLTKYNSVACISLVYSSASGVMMNHLYLDTQMGVWPQSIESISSKKSSVLWHHCTLFTVMSFYFGPCCWYFVRITEVLRTFFLCTLLDHVRPFYWLGHVFTLGPPRRVTSCRDEDSDDAMGIYAWW